MLKKMKDRLFYYLVEKNPHILREYQIYRWNNEELHRKNRLKSWMYLAGLNIKHRILRISHQNEQISRQANMKLPYLEGAESESYNRPSPHHFAAKLLKYDIISFDVFDTLLLRPFNDPKSLFMLLGEKHDCPDFMNIRIKAEQTARQHANVTKGNSEVTIYDIYEIIERRTGINKEHGIKVEFETELDLCFANPYMKRVFDILKSQGKKIIATSDMYLPKKMIQQLLEKCGYVGFEEIFVSCDYNCNKRNTYLYKVVLNKIGENKRVVHIGDNYESDILSAEKVDIDTKYYKNVNDVGNTYRADGMSELVGSAYSGIVNAQLHNGTKQFSPYYEYGFIYGGLYILGYSVWIHDYCKKNGIEKVLFLSRDGDIYQKVFNLLFDDIPNEYVLWSRIANTKYTASRNRDDFLTRMVAHKAGGVISITLGSLLESMNLSILESELSKFNLVKDEIVHHGNVKQIENLFIENWDTVVNSYSSELNIIEQYFRNVIGLAKKIAIIDVGWIGSGARGIKYLIQEKWNIDCEVHSLLAASSHHAHTANLDQLMKGETKAYIFSRMKNRMLYDNHVNSNKGTNNIYFELFTQACSPSYAGMNYSDNKLKILFDVPEVENYQVVKEIQAGILDFAQIYAKTFANYQFMYRISGYDAYLPFRMIIRDLQFIKSHFGKVSFARGVGANLNLQRTETLEEILHKASL